MLIIPVSIHIQPKFTLLTQKASAVSTNQTQDPNGSASLNSILGDGDNIDEDDNIRLVEPDEPVINKESQLRQFCAVLQQAQQAALEHARESSKIQKRPMQHRGDSIRTFYRHKRTRVELAKKGFLGIFEFKDYQDERKSRQNLEEEEHSVTTDLEQDEEEEPSENEDVHKCALGKRATRDEISQDQDTNSAKDHHTNIPTHANIPTHINHILDGHASFAIPDPLYRPWKDLPTLRAACTELAVRGKDKTIDIIFRAHIMAMVGVLNLYLDPELHYGWEQASIIVAKSQGHGVMHAWNL